MKRIVGAMTVLAAAFMISSAPLRAEEGSMERMMDQDQRPEKDQCLLVAMNCGNQVDSIQQRIDRLQREISRGTDVYSTDELRSLENQLQDAERTMEGLERDRS